MPKLPRLIVTALIASSTLICAAQDKGFWPAASHTASSITGDITIADAKITIDFVTFPLAPIRKLTPGEVGAAFDADVNAGYTGNLYRLNVPAGRRFEHRNTLCGSEETQWMATYVSGSTLQVAFFSGDAAPVFTVDAIANSTDLCGTFTYSR